jgi:hypothetical protein
MQMREVFKLDPLHCCGEQHFLIQPEHLRPLKKVIYVRRVSRDSREKHQSRLCRSLIMSQLKIFANRMVWSLNVVIEFMDKGTKIILTEKLSSYILQAMRPLSGCI